MCFFGKGKGFGISNGIGRLRKIKKKWGKEFSFYKSKGVPLEKENRFFGNKEKYGNFWVLEKGEEGIFSLEIFFGGRIK